MSDVPMSAAEKRRQKILARSAERMEAVTASYHKETAKTEEGNASATNASATNASASNASALPEVRESTAPEPASSVTVDTHVSEDAPSPSPATTNVGSKPGSATTGQGPRLPEKRANREKGEKKRVGTLYQEKKWGEYTSNAGASSGSSSAVAAALKRKNSLDSSLKVATMSYVERMQAAVPVSRWLRLLLVFVLTMLLCAVKEGSHLIRGEDSSRVFVQNEQRMVENCSGLLTSANIFRASSFTAIPEMARACVGSTRVVAAMVLAAQSQFAWVAAIERPIAYVGLMGTAAVVIVSVASYVFPGVLARHIDDTDLGGNDAGAMMKKVMGLLPKNVLTAFHGVNLLRTMVNAAFMDASCYIIIVVTYQLAQLL